MLKESKTNEEFEYQRLSPEEQQQRGILGRLVGVAADFIHPTRNGRKYSEQLWENVFNDPIMKEKIANRCCFGELGHPSDRTETDMEKIAICLAEQPTKGSDGKLRAVFDILNTPCGRILKSLCDYGCNIGISSRGEGDLITDYDGGESVDPDTYTCECWDAVLIPAVKEARMQYVSESLERTRYNKTLREKLQESLAKANDNDRKIMEEALNNLHINLNEEAEEEPIEVDDSLTADEQKSLDMLNQENDENLEEATDVTEKVIIRTNEDGFLTKMYELKDQGYKVSWSGNNQICMVKPKDIKDESLNINEGSSPKYAVVVKKGNKWLIWGGAEDKSYIDGFLERHPEYDDVKLIPNGGEEYQAIFNDTQPEMDDINEGKNVAVDNNEAIVEELQKLIKTNAALEQQVIDLQEKLSVCYAKEAKIEEQAEKYKNTVKSLAEGAREAGGLKVKIETLEHKLNESKERENRLGQQLKEAKEIVNSRSEKAKTLKENFTSKLAEVEKLTESVTSLKASLKEAKAEAAKAKEEVVKSQREVTKLKESFESEKSELNESIAQLNKDKDLQKVEYSQKLGKAKKLIEKYKNATASAVDKYIELQAVRLGSSVNEVKNRLPESYSFKDIDKACEDLQDYNLNMSKLPFNALSKKSINENVKIKGTSSKNESILPAANGFDDDIDEDLLYLAGRKY